MNTIARHTATAVLVAGALLSASACSANAPVALVASSTYAPSAVSVGHTPTPEGLIDQQELGPGYVRGPDPQFDPDARGLCGLTSVMAQFPDAQRFGVSWDGPQSVSVIETVSVYPDQETSDAAVAATNDSLSCGQGSVGAESVVITPREDLRADVGGDQTGGWRIGGDQFDALEIVVQSGPTVATFVFAAPTDVDTTRLPDPLDVTRQGMERLMTGL